MTEEEEAAAYRERIRWAACRARRYAYEAFTNSQVLGSRPDWATLAEFELEQAEAEVTRALEFIQQARKTFGEVKVYIKPVAA